MSYRVRFLPTGHEIQASGKASVLHAALREGLNLDHHCANGTCGECAARLVSGTLLRIRHPDYRLDPRQVAAGAFLMCCHRPASDLVLEAHEPARAADIPEQSLVARVSRVDRLQDDVLQLILRTPRSTGLRYLAGQSIALGLDGLPPRQLPIASCPCDSIQLRFHLRRRPDDAFSEHVFARLRRGDRVRLQGPTGDFTLDEESKRPIVFVAWETGFAPVASLLEHVIQKNEDLAIHLYWLSAVPRGHYLSNVCRSWQDALDNFHYHSVDLAPAGDASWASVFAAIAARHVPLADWDMYLAIPAEIRNRVSDLLCAAGLPTERTHIALLQHA